MRQFVKSSKQPTFIFVVSPAPYASFPSPVSTQSLPLVPIPGPFHL